MRSHNKEKELKETDMVINYYMNGILGEKNNQENLKKSKGLSSI